MYWQCPLREGKDGECYNSASCGGDGQECPFLNIAKNTAAKYWNSVWEAWNVWSTFAQVEGIYDSMQDYATERVKDVFRDTYHSNWAELQNAYESARRELDQAVDNLNNYGADLSFEPLSTDTFINYIEKMSPYERQRCRKLIQEFTKMPQRYPMTDLLRENFRKHQKRIKLSKL